MKHRSQKEGYNTLELFFHPPTLSALIDIFKAHLYPVLFM